MIKTKIETKTNKPSSLSRRKCAVQDVSMSIADQPKRESQASTRGPHGEDVVGMMPFSHHRGDPHHYHQHDGDVDALAGEIEELVRMARLEAAGVVEGLGHQASQGIRVVERK